MQPHPPSQISPTTLHMHNGSNIPSTNNTEGQIKGNIVGSRIYNPNKNNTQIVQRLSSYLYILWVELNTTLTGIKTIQTTQLNTQVSTNNLNNRFLINNHMQHILYLQYIWYVSLRPIKWCINLFYWSHCFDLFNGRQPYSMSTKTKLLLSDLPLSIY